MGDDLNFSQALDLFKQGKKLARRAFRDTCYVQLCGIFVNEEDKTITRKCDCNTAPYLQMVKKIKPFADGDETYIEKFPVDLSCESIFAVDWYVVE
jgi:hypothetical protein